MDQLYLEVTPSVLKSIVGSTSSMSGLSLFDSLDQEANEPELEIQVVKKLMKLRSEIIMICLEGTLTFIMDCSRPVSLRSGEVILFKEGQIIEFIEADLNSKLILMAVPQDIGLRDFKDWSSFSYSLIITPSKEVMDELCTLYRLMRKKMDNLSFSRREEIIIAYMNVIMLNLYDAIIKTDIDSSKNSALKGGNRELIIYNQFIREVKKAFTSHRDVGHYASALHLSSGHLSRIVKKCKWKDGE
ncbi:MAG: hypothetical protein K2J63_04435 [Muribaculaceae bacterium]|nr:hypothetical protein [Muribaculaceae bacterium]